METCLICTKSVEYLKLYERFDTTFTNKYDIVECPFCHIKKTLPVPEDLASLYNETDFIAPQSRLYHCLKRILIRQEMKRIVKITKARDFLDIGSGYGDFSENVSQAGYSVIAADASLHRPHYLRPLPQIPYLHFDYGKLEIADPSCVVGRVVVLRHVMEHIKEPLNFLKKLAEYKAGYVYIVVPNFGRLERAIFKDCDMLLYPPYHLWHFEKHSLQVLLEGAGFGIMASGYDTIPTVWTNILLYLKHKKYPAFIIKCWEFPLIRIPLWLSLNIISPNNVVWMMAKLK